MGEQSDKKELFEKFINNQCTTAELEQVLAYIRTAEVPPEFEVLMRENLEQKMAANRKVAPELSGKLYRNIQSGISGKERSSKIKNLSLVRKWWTVAATVSVLLLSGLLYFYFSNIHAPTQVYSTNYGEKEQILLPDGSSVVLNANSKLTFSSDWTDQSGEKDFVREVWLEGEAFFEVKKLSTPTRFLVHTDHLKVEVLGTQFDVNSRAKKTRVVLNEGKVKLLAQNQPELVMNPGELVELNKGGGDFQKKIVNPETYIAWRHNELVFEATPLIEIIDILEHNYGFDVEVQESVATREMLFTGKAPADDIALLLKMLSETFDINVSQTDKKIIFQNSG